MTRDRAEATTQQQKMYATHPAENLTVVARTHPIMATDKEYTQFRRAAAKMKDLDAVMGGKGGPRPYNYARVACSHCKAELVFREYRHSALPFLDLAELTELGPDAVETINYEREQRLDGARFEDGPKEMHFTWEAPHTR